jgi:glycosyltransferase involved in cell wall biosynthesis
MIDSNQTNARYRMAARIGRLSGSILTTPGVFQEQAEGCDLVVTRSDHERERIIDGLRIDASKVKVILNGAPAPIPTDADEIRARFSLPREFVLHVSSFGYVRKNVPRLIEAVGPTGLPLVIAGTADPCPTLDRVHALAEKFGNVTFLGYLDHQSLCSTYAACKVFCLPSEHEGTGLAALEAASYGAKVVITRNGGPPSYFKDLAEYVDPDSTESIREAILKAWKAPSSDDLRQHVLTHLTWENSARSLADESVDAGAKHIADAVDGQGEQTHVPGERGTFFA